MRLDARTTDVRGAFFDAESGALVRWVRSYDTDTEEVERFISDPASARALGVPLRSLLVQERRRLRFVPAAGQVALPQRKAPENVPLDILRRDVLRGKVLRPVILLPGMPAPECEERCCHREARWVVACEREVEAEMTADGRSFSRGVLTENHVFCHRHYRPPITTSLRGVESEFDPGLARPQW